MSKHSDVFKKITDLDAAEAPFAIASVFNVQGSSSGKVGDKALFDENGKRIIGYIGGGCIENRVAATAKETLIDGIPRTVEIDLDSDQMDMGIPCGGYMSVIVEPQMINPTLFIRGMGRVVEVLCQLASLLKFKVVVQTSADEKERYPEGPWCKKGTWVVFARYAGSRIKIDGGEVRLLNDDEVLATVENPEDIFHDY